MPSIVEGGRKSTGMRQGNSSEDKPWDKVFHWRLYDVK